MKTKICTKCKIEKPVSEFYKGNDKDGFTYWCKICVKQYRKDNAPRIAEQRRQYNKDNTPRLAEQRRQHRKDNVSQLAEYHKQHNKEYALFERYFDKLGVFEEIRPCPENLKLLEVRCAYCGKWMLPTNLQAKSRLQAFEGNISGEQRFYCSENCKQSCPIFNQKVWPKGFKKTTSREVVPLLRQLVLERDDYTCQKCGATTATAQLHVHHEKSYTLNKIMANDPDNCITFCKACHKEIHSQDGCRYIDLRCLIEEL